MDEPTCEDWLKERAEVEELRADYEAACKTIADMHAAAVGEVTGPKRGVVEDVSDLRAEVEELRALRDRVTLRLIARLPEPGGQRYGEAPDRIDKLADQRDELLGLLREFAHGDLAGEWVDTFKERLAAALARATTRRRPTMASERSSVSLGRLVLWLRKRDRRLNSIGCGGPGWSARHVWWRFYWRRDAKRDE